MTNGAEKKQKSGRTRPSRKTRAAERAEAGTPHEADLRSPQVDPPEDATLDPNVIEHEREMIERGAHQQGEGRIP
jgi:hypothetical protein